MVAQEILPNIWISDCSCSLDKTFLKLNNIKVVFNCSKDLPFTSLDIKKYRLEVNDSLQEVDQHDMSRYLPEMTEIMLNCFKTLTPILVYCKVGIQRSATLIAAFLIRYTGIRYENAIKIIQSKRIYAFRPTINFNTSLLQFSNKYSK